jgi:uncharacterized protein YceH (UPF0502 family)
MDLSSTETRVLGCLLEKQRTTPDAYPLSLNALRLACNQSTNRDPVVDYDDAIIRDALHRLERRGYTRLASGAGSRAPKYRHLLADALPMSSGEQAVMCVLMLRGPQTPGELKQRTERMHAFGDLPRCTTTLERLIERELVVRLERRPGQKEERYAQLLGEDGSRDRGAAGPRPGAGMEPTPARVTQRSMTCESASAASSTRSPAARRDARSFPGATSMIPATALIPVHLTLAASSDAASGVGIPLALAAGLVSFLSPCVLPLVPGYLSTVIGVTPADLKGAGPAACWSRACCSSRASRDLHPARMSATVIGSALNTHKQTLEQVGGVLIVADGRHLPGDAVHRPASTASGTPSRCCASPAAAGRWSPAPRSRSPGRPARASPSARSSRRRRSRAPPPTARCCWPSTPRAWRSRSC